ncbi:outer membrane beta-barrel protein [Aureimonas altamirensis]|uniref:outer membrane protein n=1 Tax=Aureimonas altamirensis TaxID=370622 RepID=UPI0020374CD3|nr:outer membrane beta-barrel protein [Aureimonas altamirensis]MCM2503953.1 outer membrane beta-barrel protein [Aureimonas altamirensis]
MNRFALLLASAAFVTPAVAADVIYEEPAPAPVVAYEPAFTWTGFYVGGQAGVAFNRDSGLFSTDSSFIGSSDDGEASFIGGGHVGYDYQMGNFLIGAVADLSYIDASTASSYTLPGSAVVYGAQQDIDYVGTVRAKLGYAADRIAVYATGGLAYGDTSNNYLGSSTATLSVGGAAPALYNVSVEEDTDDVGYSVGAGVEYLVTQNFSFGVEYLYTDLGDSKLDVTYTPVAGGTAGSVTTTSSSDLDFHTVWAKASFRFN